MGDTKSTGVITGNDVKRIREIAGLTQAGLAEAVGVAKKTAYNWESREHAALPAAAATKFANWVARESKTGSLRGQVPVELQYRVWDASSFKGEDTVSAPSGASDPEERAAWYGIDPVALAMSLHRADHRPPAEALGLSRLELADAYMGLLAGADDAIKFAEDAVKLKVHPKIAQALATAILDAVMDTGAFGVVSGVIGHSELTSRLLVRAASVRAVAALQGEDMPEPHSIWGDGNPLRTMADKAAEQSRVESAEAEAPSAPDYSGLSKADHGLAAYEGEKDIAFDADPED
ncbi:hypothetical protein DWB68_15270 [Galactobacter valiniphilus]|uniref:HTH cro/C1-type domain-containing protein n=1 Tax=Galactobacter valiniphilus TaxID=2676122 RepID=A0A399JE86_9MICC|nr:hypothetical protein [Galactobacter valiniphilus]RII40926.1 hypothetical protein DWB68_15270 [Galactobacter valiniphilus]